MIVVPFVVYFGFEWKFKFSASLLKLTFACALPNGELVLATSNQAESRLGSGDYNEIVGKCLRKLNKITSKYFDMN